MSHIVAMADDYLEDFSSGCMALDLCASLSLFKKVTSRAKDRTPVDKSFTSRLLYDNVVTSSIVKGHYTQRLRIKTEGSTRSHYHEGIDKMAWVGMVMSDMGAMHTKPLMSALIMAASQLVTWHDFLFKCSEKLAGQAFVANQSALDYVSL